MHSTCLISTLLLRNQKITGSAKYLYFFLNALKSYWIFSQISFFYLKLQFFRLKMENNFIQMAALADHAVAYTIGTILAPRWPNDINSAADNAIFKNRAQNTDCSFSCVARSVRSAVLLKLNVAKILLFNFSEQEFVQHGPITIAIDCNDLSLLIFEEKLPNYVSGVKSATKQWLVLAASAFQCMHAGFLCLKCNNFACLYTRQDQNELHLKRWFFFAKIVIFWSICPNISQRCSNVYTNIFVRRKDKTNYLSDQTWAKCYHLLNKHELKKMLNGGPYI